MLLWKMKDFILIFCSGALCSLAEPKIDMELLSTDVSTGVNTEGVNITACSYLNQSQLSVKPPCHVAWFKWQLPCYLTAHASGFKWPARENSKFARARDLEKLLLN